MTEALCIAPGSIEGIKPKLPCPLVFELPIHLKRRELKAKQEKGIYVSQELWNGRGEAIETRVQSVIATQTDIVKTVTKNPRYTENNDLTLVLVDGTVLKVEVKSSSLGIKAYKHKIRESIILGDPSGQLIGPWIRTRQEEAIRLNKLSEEEREKEYSKWLTANNTILINGGEEDQKEKIPEEILKDSFYPQLQRILKAKRTKAVSEFADTLNNYQEKLIEQKGTKQIYPNEDEQLTLPSFS